MYTRRGCHLCEVMQKQIEALASTYAFTFSLVDIDRDPELQREYDWDVPVLVIDGEKVARHRLDAALLRRRLEAPAR
jgi:hypothetical protein